MEIKNFGLGLCEFHICTYCIRTLLSLTAIIRGLCLIPKPRMHFSHRNCITTESMYLVMWVCIAESENILGFSFHSSWTLQGGVEVCQA